MRFEPTKFSFLCKFNHSTYVLDSIYFFLRKTVSIINLLLFLIFKLPQQSTFLLPLCISWRVLCSTCWIRPPAKVELNIFIFLRVSSPTIFNNSFFLILASILNIFQSVLSIAPILSFCLYFFLHCSPHPNLFHCEFWSLIPFIKSYAFLASSQNVHLICWSEWKADPSVRILPVWGETAQSPIL